MIPTQTPSEFQRIMHREKRRQRNRAILRELLLIAFLIAGALCLMFLFSCGHSERIKPDSAYIDSLFLDGRKKAAIIASDTDAWGSCDTCQRGIDPAIQREYDSTVKAEYGERRDSL